MIFGKLDLVEGVIIDLQVALFLLDVEHMLNSID